MTIPNPQILARSLNSILIALSDTEVGKIILPNALVWTDVTTGKQGNFLDDEYTFDDEIEALRYANAINDLMPKFIRKDTWQSEGGSKTYDMIVMERLYALPIDHFDLPTREIMIAEMEEKMKELHDKRFVHADFMRPTNYHTRNNFEWMFGNILQTEKGLRLTDAGFGTICKEHNIELFVNVLIRERREMGVFKKYYLGQIE